MDRFVKDHTRPSLTVSTTRRPTCCVLLRSLTDGGPVPDDFQGLATAAAIRSHVRPDGAVYKGSWQLQTDKDSVVLVWGDPALSIDDAEFIATRERPELVRRHEAAKLGPFGNTVPASAPKGVA